MVRGLIVSSPVGKPSCLCYILVYRRVCLSFGLLCLLQVTLNVTLRLYCKLFSFIHFINESKVYSMSKNKYWLALTLAPTAITNWLCLSAINESHKTCSLVVEERDQLLTNYTKLAEERDRLHKELDDLSKHNSKNYYNVPVVINSPMLWWTFNSQSTYHTFQTSPYM